jgi:proline iminopeptidase
MEPAFMQKMSTLFPAGHYLFCPDGGHMAMYDDQATYMRGLIGFLQGLER